MFQNLRPFSLFVTSFNAFFGNCAREGQCHSLCENSCISAGEDFYAVVFFIGNFLAQFTALFDPNVNAFLSKSYRGGKKHGFGICRFEWAFSVGINFPT